MKQTAATRPVFVHCLREGALYIRQHQGKLLVLHIDESLLDRESLRSVCKDILLLHQLQVRLVVVFGVRTMVDRMLREKGLEPQYNGAWRITDRTALACVQAAAARVRDDMESMLSTVSLNSAAPFADHNNGGRNMARVVSGNFIVARPAGIIDGQDCQYTGLVRSVDIDRISSVTAGDSILLMPPLGYGHTGELFNLHALDLAAKLATAVTADKLVFLLRDRLCDDNGVPYAEIQAPQAKELWQQGNNVPEFMRQRLQLAIAACEGGVQRVHFVDQSEDGALLLELYSRDGVGTLVSKSGFDEIRPARLADLSGILQLVEPLGNQGVLLPRPRQRLEERLDDFTVLTRDGLVVACAALRLYEDEHIAEIECLAVHPEYRGSGKGRALHDYLLRQAQRSGIKHLLVLTTQALHWFYDLGYSDSDGHVVPAARRADVSADRGSRILLRAVDAPATVTGEQLLPVAG